MGAPTTAFVAGITDGTGALTFEVALPPLSGVAENVFLQAAYPLLRGRTLQRGSQRAFLAPARWVLGSGSMVVRRPDGP